MTWRRRLSLAAVVSVMGLTAFAASQGIVQAATNSDEAPHPGNSSPNDAHTFLLRKSSNFGKNPDVQLVAYYPKDIKNSEWSNAYLKLRPGGKLTDPLVCQTDGGGGSDKPRYITVTLTREDTGAQLNYRISYGNACKYNDPDHTNQNGENAQNQLFGRYYLPGSTAPGEGNANQTTNRHHIYVTIRYHDSIPENVDNTGNTAQFDVKGNTTGLKIGQLGGGEAEDDTTDGYSFPLRPDYAHVRDYPNASSAVDIPFGLPCNVVGTDLKEKRIGLFDADNGAIPFQPYRVQFRVKEVGGDYVKFISGTQKKAEIRDNGYVLRPWDGEAAYASAKIKMKTQTNYIMEITGIANGNIIDVHVPGDTIYGDIDCKWEIRPDSTVDLNVQQPGGWVNFTHTATNTKGFKSDPVTSEVMWGKQGVKTTGTISTDTDRVYNPNNNSGSRTFTNSFRIPTTATAGQEYCQYLKVKPHAYDDSTAYDSWQKGDRACVKVETPDTADEDVIVTPVVNGNMDYVEPTETATFDGYVSITNFPRMLDDEWGYTEVARQRPATRVTATPSGGLETDGPYNTAATTTTTYTCPHPSSDVRSGSTCTHTYSGNANDTKAECQANGHNWSSGTCTDTHPANSSTTNTCPATYVWNGTTCSRVRYKCSNTSTWGAWNASAPSCQQYWTCPGGAAGSGYYDTAPNCQGWKCAYYPAWKQDNQPTAPPCEYRCLDGTGNAAPQSNGWTGDMNCYVQPSFTLTCYWKNKPSFSETVTGDGQYCNNRDADANEAGVTIGTAVLAILTANYPGNSAWSSPPPGYGKNAAGVWGQHKIWRWNNFPSRSAQDTVRVVGKPTVKVFGGDVSAGGGFINNGVCGASASSMIAGWPHAPDYNAAGTQFGAFSSGTITGFSSAMINANSALAPRSLAFANFPASGGETFGGSFGNMDCALDHYGDATPTSLPTVGLSSINSNPTTPTASGSYRGSGTQIGHNPVIRNGQRIAVYVTGNVYISGNGITYQNRGAWQTVQDIPAFKLVVYGGNIYIAPSVTELSGIYVAQPNGAMGGNIYTCANNGSLIPDTNLYNSCRNFLMVNGAFIAKKVHLQRTLGTAIRGETAERFNYLPEVWLAPWPQTNSASEIKYDAIISLPPVL